MYPHDKLPAQVPTLDKQLPAPSGSRVSASLQAGAERVRQRRYAPRNALAVTDTTFRDAHQSLLATRVRTSGLLGVAGHVARPPTLQSLSIEAWGGPDLRRGLAVPARGSRGNASPRCGRPYPNVCLQMLLRGRNTVGYTAYPDTVARAFVAEAANTGIDIFRIFDALNNIDAMRPAIDAVRDTDSTVAEVALAYTGDLSNPNETLYTLDYYLKLAEQAVDAGAHILAIKDMAGLLRAPAAATLVTALRSNFDLPVHVHTHDTPGGQLATYLAAWQAGADAVDGASAAMAGTTSQPALSAIVAAAAYTEHDTGLNLANVCDLEPYWEALRKVYAPFESGLPAPTGRVYTHEIPGGQLSNLRQQAIALGLGNRFEDIEKAYAGADRLLGRLIKATPSSKVVGDLALHLVGAGVSVEDFAADPGRFDIPDSVIGFLHGDLGTPAGGWPEPLREKALAGRGTPPAVVELSVQDEKALGGDPELRKATLNRLLFPGPTKEFLAHREQFGDTSGLSANQFFYGLRQGDDHRVTLEKGVELAIGLEAISEPDEAGMRTVMGILNGQLRPVSVRDRSVAAQAPAAEKADRNDPSHVAAPFSGVVTLTVAEGDSIVAAQPIATIEAMKMEASITAPRAGTLTRLAINTVQQVEAGDLLAVSTSATPPTSQPEQRH